MGLVYLNVKETNVLIIGGGEVSFRKTMDFLLEKSKVTVIAKEFIEDFEEIKKTVNLTLLKRSFETSDLDGKKIVVCATDDIKLNSKITSQCKERGILVNNVSDRSQSDYYNVSRIINDNYEIGVSTKGLSPGISKGIKKIINQTLDKEINEFIKEYSLKKEHIQFECQDNKKELLKELSEEYYLKILGGRVD